MKKLTLLLCLTVLFFIASCKKDSQSESFKLLTGTLWVSDTLLANGVDASQPPDGMLRNFKGEAKFNEDGSGYFGIYTGTWSFAYDETYLNIKTAELAFILVTKIEELTQNSLKITTSFPNQADQSAPTNIRMTFKPK